MSPCPRCVLSRKRCLFVAGISRCGECCRLRSFIWISRPVASSLGRSRTPQLIVIPVLQPSLMHLNSHILASSIQYPSHLVSIYASMHLVDDTWLLMVSRSLWFPDLLVPSLVLRLMLIWRLIGALNVM